MRGARYQANCLPGPREPFKGDIMDLAPGGLKEWVGFLVSRSLTLSSAYKPHTVGSIRHLMNFPNGPKQVMYSTGMPECSIGIPRR